MKKLGWCQVLRNDEYPPCERVVWATDGSSAWQAAYHYGGPPADFYRDGRWVDSHGEPITVVVTHWLPLEESPGVPEHLPQIDI